MALSSSVGFTAAVSDVTGSRITYGRELACGETGGEVVPGGGGLREGAWEVEKMVPGGRNLSVPAESNR